MQQLNDNDIKNRNKLEDIYPYKWMIMTKTTENIIV